MADFNQDPVTFVKELRVSKSVMKEMMEFPENWLNLMNSTVRFHRAWVLKGEEAVAVRVVDFRGATVSELELLVQFANGLQQFFSASDVWLRSKTLDVSYPEKEFLDQHQESRQNMINKFQTDSKRPWKDYMDKPKSRDADIEALKVRHAAATKTLEAGHAAATKTLEAGHEAATKTLEAGHEAAFKTLEAGHAATTTTLEAGHAAATKTLEAKHEAAMSNLEAKYLVATTKLKNLQEKMRKEHAFDRLRNIHNAEETGARVRHQTESFCSLPGRAGVPPPRERRDKDSENQNDGASSSQHSRP
jgi:hypothetical protein